MKVLTIGRNPDCNIVFNDNMVSRRHALLKIFPNGKYEIISQGPNGTTVNGNPIVPNQPYPVKRGDMVIFAGQSKLDWRKVPNPLKPYKIGAIAFGAVALVVAAILLINFLCSDSDDVYEGGAPDIESVPADSTKQKDTKKPYMPVSTDDVKKDESGKDKAVDVNLDKAPAAGKDVKETAPATDENDPILAEILRKEKQKAQSKQSPAKTKKDKGKGRKAPTPSAKAEPAKEKAPAEPAKEETPAEPVKEETPAEPAKAETPATAPVSNPRL